MTRRGSLVSYLSAWILGCFFMSVLLWVRDILVVTLEAPLSRSAFGLLLFYFYGLVFGALAALTGAFLLRAVMSALKCKTPLHWAVAGAVLAPLLVAFLGIWGHRAGMVEGPGMRLVRLITWGPKTVLEAGWWLAIPAGAATAYVLCRIQRAFALEEL